MLGEALDLAARDDCPFYWHDARAHQLPHDIMGHADHAHIVHGRMRTQTILEFARVELQPPARNRLLPPPDDLHIPILIDDPQITGEEKSVRRRDLGGLGRHAEIAPHEIGPADGDLADRFGSMQLSRDQIHRHDLDAGKGAAHGAHTTVVAVGKAGDRDNRSGFREAVRDEHIAPATHPAHQRLVHRTAGNDAGSQRRESRRVERLLTHEEVILRGHAVQHRDLRVGDEREGARRVEGRLQHDRRATCHRAQHDAEAEDGKERDRSEHAVVGRNLEDLRHTHRVFHQRPVRQWHALGLAHRSRRVHDGQVGRLVIHRWPRNRSPGAARHEIFELEDPVVVPQILVAYRDHVLQVRQIAEQFFEALQKVDAVPVLDGDDGTRFGVS